MQATDEENRPGNPRSTEIEVALSKKIAKSPSDWLEAETAIAEPLLQSCAADCQLGQGCGS